MNAVLSAVELPIVAAYVREVCGIVIESGKGYLVESRLGPLLTRERLASYTDLVVRARADASGLLRRGIIDALATNETSFFRDQRPFDLLGHKLIPDVLEPQQGPGRAMRPRLDIWSAATSTGQEIYSLAILLKEMLFDLARYWIRILGTDISDYALTAASRGWYSTNEVARGLSERRLQRFFRPQDGGWRICDELRAQVTFAPLNLLEGFRQIGTFDIILCRNVAIYFSIPHRATLFDQLADQLRPGGRLILGSTESLEGCTQRFALEEFRGSVFYRKLR